MKVLKRSSAAAENVANGISVMAVNRRRNNSEGIKRTTLRLPLKTLDRVRNETNGGDGVCLEALIEYALDSLIQRDEIIIME